MISTRTEPQLHSAAMLITLECALNDLFPGRVSSGGSLWNRKLAVWLNDIEDMVIDFYAEDNVIARVSRVEKSSEDGEGGEGDSGGYNPQAGNFAMPQNADMDMVYDFIENVVVEAANCTNTAPGVLVQKIADVAVNTPRLQRAKAYVESTSAGSSTFQPG